MKGAGDPGTGRFLSPVDAPLRSAAVLAAAALVVVPLVNALVLEARQTADRQVADPPDVPEPDDPPRGQPSDERSGEEEVPPEETPERDRRGNVTGNCTPVPEERPAAAWHHPSPEDAPLAAAQRRADHTETRSFRVSDLHPAVHVELQVEDLVGGLEARVHPEGAPDDAPFEAEPQGGLGSTVEVSETLTRPDQVATGGWTASLVVDEGTYRELSLTVVRAICQEAPG